MRLGELRGQLHEDRRQLLAVAAPGRVELDEEVGVLLDCGGEVGLVEHQQPVDLLVAAGRDGEEEEQQLPQHKSNDISAQQPINTRIRAAVIIMSR